MLKKQNKTDIVKNFERFNLLFSIIANCYSFSQHYRVKLRPCSYTRRPVGKKSVK